MEKRLLEIDDGLHGLGKGVLPLLESLDEPLCAVNLSLHKSARLFPFPIASSICLFQHLGILAVDSELRDIEARHLESHCSILKLQHEIRHYLLRDIVV